MSILAKATAPGAATAIGTGGAAIELQPARKFFRCSLRRKTPVKNDGFMLHDLAVSLIPVPLGQEKSGDVAIVRLLDLELRCSVAGAAVVSGRQHRLDLTLAPSGERVFDAVLKTPAATVAWDSDVQIVGSVDGAPTAPVAFETWEEATPENSTWGVSFDAAHSSNCALVRILSAGGKFTFELKHGAQSRKIISYDIAPPALDTDDFVDTLDHFIEFSERVPGLGKWLDDIVATHPNDLVIVIEDHTDFGLPWEMLPLANDKPLGASVDVVRWDLIELRGSRIQIPNHAPERRGKVVAYLDARLAHLDEERQALAACDVEHVAFGALPGKLNKLPSGCALVFLGCHAFFKRNQGRTKILHPDNGEALTPSVLARMKAPPAGERPAVLLNGCFSARFSLAERGFPQVLLSKLETEYIGTLGYVNDQYASQIGARIVRAGREAGGASLSATLRALREEAAAAYRRDSFDADIVARYVTTFSYVLYGSHRAVIVLAPRAQGGALG